MSITKDELVEVLRAQSSPRNTTSDLLLKIGTSISTAGILALGGLIFSFNNDINTLSIQQQYAAEQMRQLQVKMDDFTKLPRFSRDDYLAEIAPLRLRIEKNEILLSGRSEWMDKINSRVSKIETELELELHERRGER